MELIIYADFNCACCYLASQRVNRLLDRGAAVQWRAVERAPHLALLGASDATDQAERLRELAEAASLALPGETLPTAAPPFTTNTRAAVAAYAEAVGYGAQDEVRRRIFHAIWAQRRQLSSAYQVRRIITDVMYPQVPIDLHRGADRRQMTAGDQDRWKVACRLSGTIAPGGGPLVAGGHRLVRAWCDQWRVLACPPLPLVIDPGGGMHHGPTALALLADLSSAAVASAAAFHTQSRSVVSPAA